MTLLRLAPYTSVLQMPTGDVPAENQPRVEGPRRNLLVVPCGKEPDL